jgi:hypothetical protein
MWRLEDIIKSANSCQAEIKGVWYPSRPMIDSWLNRLKDAWEVYRGRADAVKWPGGQ